jgi:hypothetical protein
LSTDGLLLFCPTAPLFRCCFHAVIQEQHNGPQAVDNVSEKRLKTPT